MSAYTLGFIGVGHMGSALAEAAVKNCRAVAVSNRTAEKAKALSGRLGCAAESVIDTAKKSHYVVVGVKPQNIGALFEEIGPVLRAREDRFVLVSMAAGVTMERLRREAGMELPIIRIMPNTPVAVGAGCTLFAANELVTAAEREEFQKSLAAAGTFVDVPETLFDAGSALSGSGPAYVYRFVIALAKAGEALGFAPETAMELAKETVSGAALLALESGETPQTLCDAVCSPGGSTIEGVKVMNASDFDDILAATLRAAWERNRELGKA